MRFFISVLALFLIFTEISFAQTFINISAEPEDSFNAVLVEKEGKWLHVVKVAEGNVTVLKSFQVMTGKNGGDKSYQGDEKTPEGVYFVTGFLSPERLRQMYGEIGKQYGTGAFPLSYPNMKDRLDKKTGGGIWLHGIDPNREETSTKGCVAFENDKLVMLKDYVTVGTPVVITGEGLQGTIDDLRNHFNEIKQSVVDFASAWQKSDIDTYKSYYRSDFSDTGGRSFDGYFKYKKYLMDLFPYRRVDVFDFRVFSQSATESVAEFDQYYCAPNVASYGRKRLYLEKGEDSLKIVTEEFIPKSTDSYVREKVNNFILSWKKAWEEKDVERYMLNYSENFSTRGMDKAAWKADKDSKFAKLSNIKVEIENIKYTASSPVSYSVEFKQKYTGDEYSDTGIKTLRLEGCAGDFKIKSEFWRAE